MNEMKNYLTILMRIKLRILDRQAEPMMGEEDSSNTFEIKYFPVNDMSSFLVWHSIYDRKMKEYSYATQYSEIKFQNEYYNIKEVLI